MNSYTIIKKIKRKLYKYYNLYIGDKTKLLILDDFFPNQLSVFRYLEFDFYLKNFKSIVYTTGEAISLLDKNTDLHKSIQLYPLKNKVKVFNFERKCNAKLAFVVFLGNAYKFLPYLEKNKIPFVFTLYPGGGFVFGDEVINNKLRKIFESQYFKKVIVTQNVTLNYLLENSLCKREYIEFIFGCPCKLDEDFIRIESNNDTFDICFVAAKYMEKGIDKGYDIFIEVAKALHKVSDKFCFHVVGGFSEKDIDVNELRGHITFYGYLSITELKELYKTQKIILSPNRANVLSKGAFDGFPTASVVEAGLSGVVMLITDELKQNVILTDKQDFILINHDVTLIVENIKNLFDDRNKLNAISRRGHEALKAVFSYENQLDSRKEIISKIIE